MMKKVIFLLLFGATIFVSCKKSDLPAPTPTPTDKTDKTAPSVPTNLTQGTVTASSVTFSFTGSTDQGTNGGTPSGVSGYKVYVNGAEKNTVSVSGTTVTDNSVSPSTTYSYTVAAYDASGNVSGQSTALSVTTPAAPVPAPTVTTATISGIGNFTMSASATVTGSNLTYIYAIREWVDPANGQTKKDSVNKGTIAGNVSQSWSDNIPGMKYKIYFSASNTSGYAKGTPTDGQNTGQHKGMMLNADYMVCWTSSDGNQFVAFSVQDGNIGGTKEWNWQSNTPFSYVGGATNNGMGMGRNNCAAVNATSGVQPNDITRVATSATVTIGSNVYQRYLGCETEYDAAKSCQTYPGVAPFNGNPIWDGYWTSNQGTLPINAKETGSGPGYGSSSKGGPRAARWFITNLP
jgi:chitodextrinase